MMIRKILCITLYLFLASFIFTCCASDEKVFCAAFTDTLPVIDGDLKDPCWEKAEKVSDFVLIGSASTPAPKKTTFQALYTKTHLYLATEVWLGDSSVITSPKKKAGVKDQYVGSYSVEIFLDPQASGVNYYQFVWNVKGIRYDGFKDKGVVFDGTWKSKTKITPDRWFSEIAIPLSELQNSELIPGSKWGFNLCRNDINNFAIWRHTGGSFHDPTMFGIMIIGDYKTWWNENFNKKILEGIATLKKERLPEIENNKYLNILYKRILRLSTKLHSFDISSIDSHEEFLNKYEDLDTINMTMLAINEYLTWQEGNK